LEVGEISDPITVLEGIVIIQLMDRKLPELRPYEQVRDRAQSLLRRDAADRQWQALLSNLHEVAIVQINEEYIASIPDAR